MFRKNRASHIIQPDMLVSISGFFDPGRVWGAFDRGFYPWFFYVATEALLVAQIDIDDGAVFGNDEHLFDDMCLTGGHGDDAAGMISTGWEADVLRCNAKLRQRLIDGRRHFLILVINRQIEVFGDIAGILGIGDFGAHGQIDRHFAVIAPIPYKGANHQDNDDGLETAFEGFTCKDFHLTLCQRENECALRGGLRP